MRLVDKMRDEKLGCAIINSFTKGYAKPVEMSVYNYVLPFLYCDIFRNNILNSRSFEDCVELSMQENLNFGEEIIQAIEDSEIVTSKILGLALINKMISFDVYNDKMSGFYSENTVLDLNEALILGKWFSELSIETIIDSLTPRREKIVILGSNTIGQDVDLSYYRNLGEIAIYPMVNNQDIPGLIKDATIVVTNKNTLNQETLSTATKLRLICLFATGYDNVDINYCKSRGIKVANVKGYSTATVVQHTFALFFYLYEKLPYYDHYVKSGKYINDTMFSHFEKHFNELVGKTWGIVGLGEIGKKVAQVAEVFGANVIYYSTSGRHNDSDYRRVNFDTLLKESDVISIHAPLNDNTVDLFDGEALQKMKRSAYLINIGRGSIVNEADLCYALEQRIIAGAALDVLSSEPMRRDNPLIRIKNSLRLIITPHIAWASVEARNRVAKEVYINIESFLNHQDRNIVG